ncbi:MAG TPA: hypothetical protein VFU29_00390 [Chitinophagaceae bacterium]|nr:hypothetical protein [Chitinophagaceae bacterium]
MKKIFFINVLIFLTCLSFSQEALKIQSGGSITVQNGVELVLQGGVTLDNGSSLLNNGTILLKNNTVSNISNWTDNSILGALTGTGIVIFNSTHPQQFTGPTSFYTVYINTDQLTINNDLNISNLLRLIKGKINTTNFVVVLVNTAASSLENDITNTGYINSWINGNFRRSIATNTSSYDFPVGNSERSNLLKFINNNITGPSSLTSSFIPKPGTDAGLNVTENGNVYTAVNNGGVWKLIPNIAATGGNYALQLYFNGFTGLLDNRFGILRRPDASSNAADWTVPTGSLLEPLNGTGRKVGDGFARRFNIPDFSQFGIGEFNLATPCEINGQSAVCIGSSDNIYSGPPGMTTYLWSVTPGATIIGSNTGPSVSISVAGAGSFTVNLITTLNGVTAQCSKTVSVSLVPTCDITGPNEMCAASLNGYLGPINMLTYSWTTSPGLNIVGPNTNALVNVTSSVPGPQMLTLNTTGIGGCVSQCTKIIQVKPLPPCGITGSSNITSGTANNQYTAPANLSSYSWSIGGNGSIVGTNTNSSVNVTAGAAGSFTLTLTTTLNGCSITCNKIVIVDPSTTYSCNISGPSEVCHGSLDVFTAPANLTSYTWNVTGNATIIGSNTGSSISVGATIPDSYTLSLETMLNGVSCSSRKTVNIIECVNACTYTQGFYGNEKGKACYSNTGTTMTSSQLMVNAFGVRTSQVFGNIANKKFFTLFTSDITSGNIYKMLPGRGNAKSIDVDNVLPFDGAYYADQSTWPLVPLETKGSQKGKIRNSLLAQTMTLWFNIQNSSNLGNIILDEDTLLTKATSNCGNTTPVGEASKFGLPHSVILYLNGGNGYPATVNGLYALANDVLGGVNTTMDASTVQEAVDIINNAFDECRVLVGTIPYNDQSILKIDQVIVKTPEVKATGETNALRVAAYPNPYKNRFQLLITSSVMGMARIEFFTLNGQKVYEMNKQVTANSNTAVTYTGPLRFATLVYKVTVEKNIVTGIVLKPN